MREERGTMKGDVAIAESIDLWGTIVGNVSVVKGGKLYVRGNVYGNLTVEDGGRVHIYGNVSGDLIVLEGAKVIHSGVLGGDAINRGGRLYIDAAAQVMGRVRAGEGETHIDPKAKVRS